MHLQKVKKVQKLHVSFGENTNYSSLYELEDINLGTIVKRQICLLFSCSLMNPHPSLDSHIFEDKRSFSRILQKTSHTVAKESL